MSYRLVDDDDDDALDGGDGDEEADVLSYLHPLFTIASILNSNAFNIEIVTHFCTI